MRARARRRALRIAIPVGTLAVGGVIAAILLMRGDGEPVVSKIAIDGRPSAAAVAAGLVWVTDDENHVVHVIDPSDDDFEGEPIPVDRNPIAIAGDERAVWVAHATGSVVRIDADTRRASEPIDVGGSLTGIAVSDRRVWVADLEKGEVVEIDPRGVRVVERIELRDGAVRVALGREGDVWVSGQEDTVTKVSSRRSRPTVPVGQGPIGLASGRGEIWVANSDDDTVTAIDPDEAEVVATIGVGDAPVAVAASGDVLWAANQDDGTLSRIDQRTRQEAGPPIDVGTHLRELAVSETVVWAVGTNPSVVIRVDL